MIRDIKPSVYAPFVAIGALALVYVAAQYWLFPPEETPEPQHVSVPKGAVEPPPPSIPAAPVSEVSATGAWPLYHGGYDLRGNAAAAFPANPVRLWQYLAQGPIKQPPVADEQGIYFATSTGVVVSLDFSGNERWTRQVSRRAPGNGAEIRERFEAPTASIRSSIFVGSTAGIVYAFESVSGNERWTYDVGGEILGTVNVYESDDPAEPVRLFVIERSEGALHCVDFESGRRVWRADPVNRADGSAVAGNGMVVFGSCAAAIHVYSVFDGRLMRNIDLCGDCQVAAGVALAGDDLFAGSRSGRFYRVNARVGSVIWSNQDAEKDIFTTPALGSGVVVYGSEDGFVYALDPDTGKLKWRFDAQGNPASPVLAGDRVLISANGTLQFLNAETGESTWRYEVSDTVTAPSIINGMIVVGGEDGSVTAFGAAPTPAAVS